MKEKPGLALDIRVVERMIREGVIKKDDYEEHLKNLPDVIDKGCPLIIDDEQEEELKVTEHETDEELVR
jgi:hypothetical protein